MRDGMHLHRHLISKSATSLYVHSAIFQSHEFHVVVDVTSEFGLGFKHASYLKAASTLSIAHLTMRDDADCYEYD